MTTITVEDVRPGMYVATVTGLASEDFRQVVEYPFTINGRTGYTVNGGDRITVPEGATLNVLTDEDF